MSADNAIAIAFIANKWHVCDNVSCSVDWTIPYLREYSCAAFLDRKDALIYASELSMNCYYEHGIQVVGVGDERKTSA